MKVGYVRTSKKDQNPDLQRRELLAFGCEKIFEEQISSRKEDRPELKAAMDYCREGDEFVVWKLDRFDRSLKELIELLGGLRERDVEFVSVRENIDTTTPGGKLVFHVFGAVAEFERDLILERTVAGLEAARARGRKGGRRPVIDDRKISLASKPHARPIGADIGGVRGGGCVAGYAIPILSSRRDSAAFERRAEIFGGTLNNVRPTSVPFSGDVLALWRRHASTLYPR